MIVDHADAAGGNPRRLYVYNGGFWRKPRLHRIMALAGWSVSTGIPASGDTVGIWGASPTAWRGRAVAGRRNAAILTVEDAFLRSVLPGRAAGALARRGPLGLLIDPDGVHFDPARPSRIERLIVEGNAATRSVEAAAGIARLRAFDLSKYNAHRPDLPSPEQGYVLIIDQTRGDASLMGAGRDVFLRMLDAARQENPGARMVLRSHPETTAGLRAGHFATDDLLNGDLICDQPISPWKLIEGASKVYSVSSQLAYEAVLAGHRPRIFGQPFYAGWGLSDDERPLPSDRRGTATKEALFAASHLLAPVWYDPCRDRLTDFNGAVDQLEAEVRTYREDRDGHLAYGMRLWKRRFIAQAFGDARPIRFVGKPSPAVTISWASRAHETPGATLIEDGFLRSRGLGAALTPPLSLVADDLGIYYDPGRESRLECLINAGPSPGGEARAKRLIAAITAAGLSKYNLSKGSATAATETERRVILVPGQVEDDASIRLGAGAERRNIDLLQRTRAENPDAFVIYKPHPDVEAGLRPGAIPRGLLAELADQVIEGIDAAALLEQVDEVWTITSTLGFEALLRDIPVTVLGTPFYAGWGLTRDLGSIPSRRKARPSLAALVHACLIAYPRYRDPSTGLPCPPEIAVARLADPKLNAGGPGLRLLSKAQGALAGHSWIWRR